MTSNETSGAPGSDLEGAMDEMSGIFGLFGVFCVLGVPFWECRGELRF